MTSEITTSIGSYKNVRSFITTISKRTTIEKIARGSVLDVGHTFLCTAATACFVATPALPSFLAVSATYLACTILLRGFVVVVKESLKENPSITKEDQQIIISGLDCSLFLPSAFFDMCTLNIVRHELGHVAAANLLWKNAKPKFEVSPFIGGVTHWHGSPLSSLGSKIGKQNAETIVAAGGTIASMGSVVILLLAAHSLRNKSPQISRQLMAIAITTVFQHVIYALSAFILETPGHDFINLWKKANIHPFAAIVVMVAIPILTQAALMGISYAANKWHRSCDITFV